jgi:hypothetical protein
MFAEPAFGVCLSFSKSMCSHAGVSGLPSAPDSELTAFYLLLEAQIKDRDCHRDVVGIDRSNNAFWLETSLLF